MRASDDTAHTPSLSSIRWLVGDFRRTLQVCAFVVVVSGAIGLVATVAPPLVKSGPPPHTEAELRTGSMLIMNPDSNLCQQRTIENDTWRIRNGSLVDCEDALAKAAGGPPPGNRIELIREGFRRK
jgi:hypothetical protein